MNYRLLENGIEIFGLKGYDLGKTWMVQFPDENGPIPVEVQPCSVMEDIVAIVRGDIAAGKENKIDHILVSANGALILYLEGAITPQHFQQAHCANGIIDLWVQVEGKTRKLRIVDDEQNPHRMYTATIDRHGTIV